MARVLPFGGPLLNSPKVMPLSLQTVDRPNAYARFSRTSKTQSKTNTSTVFAPDPPPSAGRHSKKAVPQLPTPEISERRGLRITHMESQQSATARDREIQPRKLRHTPRVEPNPNAIPERTKIITGNGLTFSGGKKVDSRKFIETSGREQPMKDYISMDRYRCSERLQHADKNVMNPETLPSNTPPFKEQRFRCSPTGRYQSLLGVMAEDPAARVPPPYRPVAPFHTEP